ncbi:MAG: SAM-dependent methyltransferase [Crocinitomicaceae bacterium]|nr:SAM-dependent methyltransferase [Crocinitomicaceae bacterium]
MHRFWDERYQQEGVYGRKPNPFWVRQLDKLSPEEPNSHLLLPCEGEGRNAVWAARKGWKVDAFDGSAVATKTCERWAEEANVQVKAHHADAFEFKGEVSGYSVVGLFYAHMPAHLRSRFHRRVSKWLRPGGRLILEGFEPRQLGLHSGGPKDEAMLFTPEILASDFDGLEVILNETASVELDEGPYHQGPAHIIQFIAQKST